MMETICREQRAERREDMQQGPAVIVFLIATVSAGSLPNLGRQTPKPDTFPLPSYFCIIVTSYLAWTVFVLARFLQRRYHDSFQVEESHSLSILYIIKKLLKNMFLVCWLFSALFVFGAAAGDEEPSWRPALTASLGGRPFLDNLNILLAQSLRALFVVPGSTKSEQDGGETETKSNIYQPFVVSHWDTTKMDLSAIAAQIPHIGVMAKNAFSTASLVNADLIATYEGPDSGPSVDNLIRVTNIQVENGRPIMQVVLNSVGMELRTRSPHGRFSIDESSFLFQRIDFDHVSLRLAPNVHIQMTLVLGTRDLESRPGSRLVLDEIRDVIVDAEQLQRAISLDISKPRICRHCGFDLRCSAVCALPLYDGDVPFLAVEELALSIAAELRTVTKVGGGTKNAQLQILIDVLADKMLSLLPNGYLSSWLVSGFDVSLAPGGFGSEEEHRPTLVVPGEDTAASSVEDFGVSFVNFGLGGLFRSDMISGAKVVAAGNNKEPQKFGKLPTRISEVDEDKKSGEANDLDQVFVSPAGVQSAVNAYLLTIKQRQGQTISVSETDEKLTTCSWWLATFPGLCRTYGHKDLPIRVEILIDSLSDLAIEKAGFFSSDLQMHATVEMRVRLWVQTGGGERPEEEEEEDLALTIKCPLAEVKFQPLMQYDLGGDEQSTLLQVPSTQRYGLYNIGVAPHGFSFGSGWHLTDNKIGAWPSVLWLVNTISQFFMKKAYPNLAELDARLLELKDINAHVALLDGGLRLLDEAIEVVGRTVVGAPSSHVPRAPP